MNEADAVLIADVIFDVVSLEDSLNEVINSQHALHIQWPVSNLTGRAHAKYAARKSGKVLERLSTTFTANCRDDHVTMFTPHLPLAVFSFSEKLSSFALASKARIILHYCHLCTHFFQENRNANLTFAVCRKRDSIPL